MSFKEIYACDILTSFTRTLSSGAYGLCYLVSSSYDQAEASLHNFGYCQSIGMTRVISLISILPVFWR